MVFKLNFVEPLLLVYLFAQSMSEPAFQVYIYRRILNSLSNFTVDWESYGANHGASHHSEGSCALTKNSSHNEYTVEEEAQQKTARFYLYLTLAGFVPITFAGLVMGALSDNHGRRMALMVPLIGDIFSTVAMMLLIDFDLPLWMLYISKVFAGFLGGTTTLLSISFAYMADTLTMIDHNWRVALMEMVLGIAGISASFASGEFMNVAPGMRGLLAPFYFQLFADCLCLLYVVVCLRETVNPNVNPTMSPNDGSVPLHSQEIASDDNHQQQHDHQQPHQGLYAVRERWRDLLDSVKETVAGFALLINSNGDSAGRRRLSWLLATFTTFVLPVSGAVELLPLYQQGPPLCWGGAMVGFGQAAYCCVYVTSFLGVVVMSRVRVPDVAMVVVGAVSFAGGMVMTALARTTLNMFLSNILLMFTVMPLPVLHSMLSKAVQHSQHGALFGAMAFAHMVGSLVSTLIFNSVYIATAELFPGFSFILAAILAIIPTALIVLEHCMWPQQPLYTPVATESASSTFTYGSIS